MASKLGVYWSVMHRRPSDYDYFQRLQPAMFKIMDGGPPDYQWARDNLPNSLIIARDWALSEQHDDMRRDPVGTGKRHAEEWDAHQRRLGFDRGKTLILGINEPRVWEPGVPEALRQYTIALCDRATALNLRVGAMQLSVGWPANTGPDTPPNWSPWGGVEDAIQRNFGALVCHEYWADKGPSEMWGWWAGRSLHCPWNVPIVIGECGVDMFVKDASVPHNSRGWRGRMEPERYARELADYTTRMSADPRFRGCCVFASDFANGEWFSFDLEPAYTAILATPIPDAPPTKPVDTRLPAVSNPASTMYVKEAIGVNLRTRPIDGDILIAVPYGEKVRVVGVSDINGWLRVQYSGKEGYMAAAFINETKPPPLPPPSVTPISPLPTAPRNEQEAWKRSISFTARWEGQYQAVYNDAGNWTGGKVGVGELKGTNWGVSAASYPHLDIKNLSREQAHEIFRRDYWIASGASSLPWPACLLVFDTAILHGVGTAKQWLKEVGPNPYLFAAKRLRSYTKMGNWDYWGKAWTLRVSDLLEEISK